VGRNRGSIIMKGISATKARENSIRYREIFDRWVEEDITLEQLGNEYGVTKQRMWQIVTRCKLAEGDYYRGVNLARNKWTELYSTYQNPEQTKRAFNEWLASKEIKVAVDNKKTAPHTGWDLS